MYGGDQPMVSVVRLRSMFSRNLLALYSTQKDNDEAPRFHPQIKEVIHATDNC